MPRYSNVFRSPLIAEGRYLASPLWTVLCYLLFRSCLLCGCLNSILIALNKHRCRCYIPCHEQDVCTHIEYLEKLTRLLHLGPAIAGTYFHANLLYASKPIKTCYGWIGYNFIRKPAAKLLSELGGGAILGVKIRQYMPKCAKHKEGVQNVNV